LEKSLKTKAAKIANAGQKYLCKIMYYATRVNSLNVYSPSQYSYQNERNFRINQLYKRKNSSRRVLLNLTVYGIAN